MITYQEIRLETILDYFAKGFKPNDATEEIISVESLVDAQKGIVMFKIYTVARSNSEAKP